MGKEWQLASACLSRKISRALALVFLVPSSWSLAGPFYMQIYRAPSRTQGASEGNGGHATMGVERGRESERERGVVVVEAASRGRAHLLYPRGMYRLKGRRAVQGRGARSNIHTSTHSLSLSLSLSCWARAALLRESKV
jgi:hypothetical protein